MSKLPPNDEEQFWTFTYRAVVILLTITAVEIFFLILKTHYE